MTQSEEPRLARLDQRINNDQIWSDNPNIITPSPQVVQHLHPPPQKKKKKKKEKRRKGKRKKKERKLKNNPKIIPPGPQVFQNFQPPPQKKKKNIFFSPQNQRTRGPARVTWRKTMPLGEDWVVYYLQSLSGFKGV